MLRLPLIRIPELRRASHERFRLGGNAIVTGSAGDLGFVVSRALLEHGVQDLMDLDVSPAEAEVRVSVPGVEFPDASIRS